MCGVAVGIAKGSALSELVVDRGGDDTAVKATKSMPYMEFLLAVNALSKR
jgi:hypothetical protein